MCVKRGTVKLSTYTADVSGVCSALYELGGMVVIHDPSGCNSTYNTHDEPRWYDMDSLVFISGLSLMDAIMGNDEKFIEEIVRAAEELSPGFIALVRTPVPFMTGTDFEAIAGILEEKTKLPVYYFPTTGMHSYVKGVGMALEMVAKHMVQELEKSLKRRDDSINILGATPLDFSVNTTISSLKKALESEFHILSTFAMGSRPDEITKAGEASVNLVISSAGLPAARVLRERFGTPYVIGMPVEGLLTKAISLLKTGSRTGKCQVLYDRKKNQDRTDPVYVIGEAVVSQSLKEAIFQKTGMRVRVLCPLEAERECVAPGMILKKEEEEIRRELIGATMVIADPIYQEVCPPDCSFISLPHEAYSGRIYRKQIPDFLHIFSDLSLQSQ